MNFPRYVSDMRERDELQTRVFRLREHVDVGAGSVRTTLRSGRKRVREQRGRPSGTGELPLQNRLNVLWEQRETRPKTARRVLRSEPMPPPKLANEPLEACKRAAPEQLSAPSEASKRALQNQQTPPSEHTNERLRSTQTSRSQRTNEPPQARKLAAPKYSNEVLRARKRALRSRWKPELERPNDPLRNTPGVSSFVARRV